MAKRVKEITYSEAMAQIERTLERFKNEELSVDELAQEVKQATELISLCRAKLYGAEQEIKSVLSNEEID